MSPRIGMALDVAGWAPEAAGPVAQIRQAIRIVESQGFRVRPGAPHGVGQNLITLGWTADARAREVSLAGAICLALQPLESLTTVEEGAVAALERSPEWVAGVLDGFDDTFRSALATSAAGLIYADALRVGRGLRNEAG